MEHGTQVIDLVADRMAPGPGGEARLAIKFGAAPVATASESEDPIAAAIAAHRFGEFDLDYDAEEKILFWSFAFAGRPCFTNTVLREAQAIQHMVAGFFGDRSAAAPPVRYVVLGSRVPGVWNLGADLDLLAMLVRNRDRAMLRRYAHACCEVAYANATGLGFDLPVVSVSLVQGDSLGSGFETALSSDLVIAERGATFGLPEILFNLFPGMGAYTFLSRRIAPGLAERLIMSGEIYSAEQLHAMGVVDVLAAEGQGVSALYDFVGRGGRRHAAQLALYRARRLTRPLNFEEMAKIADLWVEAASTLDEAGLRKMHRLMDAQERRRLRRGGTF
jgi:DSF synthase